jgi:hypothetical protein
MIHITVSLCALAFAANAGESPARLPLLCPRDDTQGAGDGGRAPSPEKQAAYNETYRQQLTEILTGYGPMFEMWFDGGNIVPINDLIDKLSPGIIAFQGRRTGGSRWVGTEHGFAPYPCWNTIDWNPGETTIDHIVLREDIRGGERIRKFLVEGRRGDGNWTALGRGTQAGSLQIIPIPSTSVKAIRLTVQESAAPVTIRELPVFHVNRPVPKLAYREGARATD